MVGATAANAITVDFHKLADYGTAVTNPQPYREKGVNVTGQNGTLAWDTTPGAAYLGDSGTPFATGLMFTMNKAFSAVSFTLTALGYDYTDRPRRLPANIVVTGFAGGSTVATKKFVMTDDLYATQTLLLGSGFAALDALLIEIITPRDWPSCGAPCAGFDLEEVELAAEVPLPATAGLLAGAGLMLAGLRRRQRG